MIKTIFLLLVINSLSQIVLSQYPNTDEYNSREYNQIDRDNERSNEYRSHQFNEYNPQKSNSYPSQEYKEKPRPYQFEFNIDDGYGNKQKRNEKADEYGNVRGSYGYVDSYGIYRKVDYTAGPEGFVAKIHSNEPYLQNNANPADVELFVEPSPQNKPNFATHPTNKGNFETSNSRDEPNNENYDDLMSHRMRDQVYRASDHSDRNQDKSYGNRNDEGFGPNKQFFSSAMMRPQYNKQTNERFYPSNPSTFESFGNSQNRKFDDIEAYASNRRYYD